MIQPNRYTKEENICPKCGSKNAYYYQEEVLCRYYKINKENEVCQKPFKIEKDIDGCCGMECADCGEIYGSVR